ncbi:urease subunit beta [Gelatiniphilus marinus]|uniref:Urease subunit beta n=1 Tax=Gelatiniphilus marinus TaxID=1759464 RepID=A0ABW5JUP9_9FLAO
MSAKKNNYVVPGEIIYGKGDIELNAGKEVTKIKVTNTGDRPIQVGSHFHFAETNPALEFDRAAAEGKRLAIPAGLSVRFEPGETNADVELIPFGGIGRVRGFSLRHKK